MNIICEFWVNEFFKLSSGDIVLVGKMVPDINTLLSDCSADLYVGDKKIRSIEVVGEDRFSRVKEEIRQNKRALRVREDVYDDLKAAANQKIKLVCYRN